MLKTRIVGVLIVKDEIVVQSTNFKWYLPVGHPTIAVEYLDDWGIDEIILLDIDATQQSKPPNYELVQACATYCQVPLTVGGGITQVQHIEQLIRSGADKVAINSAIITNPDIIAEGAKLFGSQCIVVSIDAQEGSAGQYKTYTHSGTQATSYNPVELAKLAEAHGAGEIFLNSIDRDGSKKGYNFRLIQPVVEAINIPLIICGGVNHPQHFLEAMPFNVSALAAANFFHYTEHTAITTKSFLKSHQANIRLDTYATYNGYDFDTNFRIAKLDDEVLNQLRFEYTPREII